MSMELKLVWNDGEIVRVESAGKVSRDGWTPNRNPFADLCGPAIFSRKVLLSLSNSHYLDSTGVEWLLASNKRFKEAGGKLVVHSFNPVMSQILKMMRMDLVLNLAKDETAALEMANGAPHES
jgi:anti-anti-sigma factor